MPDSTETDRAPQPATPPAAERIQHLFVIRVWYEVSSALPVAQWRGSVDHVTTGQRHFFADLGEIDRFIRAELDG